MKKITFLIIIFLLTFFFFSWTRITYNTGQLSIFTPKNTPTPTPTPIEVGLPTTIEIPSLGVNAAIESVGLDDQGRMGVPQEVMDTGWYKFGYRPGQRGSAVIDGHFDSQTGAPAVFYNLATLQIGDKIIVTDSNNQKYKFIVTSVTSYPFDSLPMQKIFARNDKARLNLITCDGTWNRSTHNYSNRAVVFAELAF